MVLQKGFISLNEQELEHTDGGAVTTSTCKLVVTTVVGIAAERGAVKLGAKIGGTVGAAVGGPVGSLVCAVACAALADAVADAIID